MNWSPPPRPEWVLAAEAGTVAPLAEVAARPLRRDALLDEARARLGLDRDAGVGAIDGDDTFIDHLDAVCAGLEDDAALTVVGRVMTRRFLRRLLEVRFQLAAYLAADPGVRDEEIVEPLVLTGAPRSGTTIAFGLFATDPRFRAPEGWELLRPVPPPHPEAFPDPGRVALADAELRMMGTVVGGLDAIHVYDGRMPKECLSAMSLAFLSEEFTARYRMPDYARRLFAADWTPAYAMHRLTLQVLQRRRPGTRWVLKSPTHLHALPALLATYPDARVVVTHRDPLVVVPSVTSLVANLRWSFSDRVDMADIGADHVGLYAGALDGLVDAEAPGGAFDGVRRVHGRYADFARDPLGQMTAVYDGLGVELTDEVRRGFEDHLAAAPKGRHGEHHYDLGALDLDVDVTRARFDRYVARFGVPEERS